MLDLHHLKRGVMMMMGMAMNPKNRTLTRTWVFYPIGGKSTHTLLMIDCAYYFPLQLSLSVKSTTINPTRLRKASSSKRPPLRDVDNLFNEQVIERGRPRYRNPHTPEPQRTWECRATHSYTITLEFRSSSTSA